MIKRSRKTESEAYNSALNEVRYDVEHDFRPLNLNKGWYIGLDDVYYDYNELSATVFVLDDKDKVVDEEKVSIPVDAMKDYTTGEMRKLKDLMLEKINEVAGNLKDSYEVYLSQRRSESLGFNRVRTEANHYWLDRFSKHEGLAEIIASCTDKEKEELNTAIMEIMNAANDLKEGQSLSAFLDCLLAGNDMMKLANKLRRKQVWYRWH